MRELTGDDDNLEEIAAWFTRATGRPIWRNLTKSRGDGDARDQGMKTYRRTKIVDAAPSASGYISSTRENRDLPARQKIEESIINLASALEYTILERTTLRDGTTMYRVDDTFQRGAELTGLEVSYIALTDNFPGQAAGPVGPAAFFASSLRRLVLHGALYVRYGLTHFDFCHSADGTRPLETHRHVRN